MFKKVLFRRNYKNCILNKNYALVINTCNVNTCNTKVYKTCVSVKTTILVKQFERNVHVSNVFNAKQFGEIENKYVFDIVKKIQISNVNNDLVKVSTNINNAKDFTDTLNQNWRQSNATEIVNAFKSLKDYCINNNIPVSDSHFDKLVDGLMDNCENLTDIELYDLLSCLSEYPPCASFTSHNFHDIWSCLDDICCWKMSEWDYDKLFEFANLWYKLNLGRLCDFVFELLGRLVKRADHLTKDQLVNIFFLFNVVRKRPVDFEYEYALQNCISQMNIDEMAVVTLGYFKTQSKIKLDSILKPMIHAVASNSKTIHEISLTAILKAVRFSKPLKLVDDIKLMLDKLVPETNRLSDLCCLHISLMGTGLLFLHQKSVQTASEKIAKNMRVVRLKDVERILNVLSMFNYDPQTEPEIFKAAFEELHKPERMEELIKYPRCLNCALNYLSLRNIYSYELMDRVLDVEHIKTNYGTGSKVVPPELVSLNASIDVECPGYTGNRLPPLLKYRSPKWRLEWLPNPDRNKKFTATEQLVFDAINVVKKIVTNDELMHIEHVLPHFSRADIILCKEKSTGKFRKPIGFENYTLGDVMFPFNDGTLEWYAVMMLGWNNTIRDTSLPLGNMIMKERQLKKIGYKPVKDYYGDDGYTKGTVISPHGVITLRLHDRIRVDISLDRAIRVANAKNGIVLALGSNGSSSGLIHPNGRVYQYGSRVEIMANDGQGNNKFAKMWYKGVSFSSLQCALVYLVDAAGTRTTTDAFNDLSEHDFTLSIFYDDYKYLEPEPSPTCTTDLVNKAVRVLHETNYWHTDDGTENWIINNVRISQTADGLVRVGRNSNKYSIRTSPTNGSASISSPYMHCTGSMGQTRHLFVRRGERRMHYDGSTFIVRNAGHSAGFDEKHQLKVY